MGSATVTSRINIWGIKVREASPILPTALLLHYPPTSSGLSQSVQTFVATWLSLQILLGTEWLDDCRGLWGGRPTLGQEVELLEDVQGVDPWDI